MRVHQKLVDIIARELLKKPYVQSLVTNAEYGTHRVVGECDILTTQSGRIVYYEIKSTDHHAAYKKAVSQIRRWCKFTGNKYGVYVTPTRMELIRG